MATDKKLTRTELEQQEGRRQLERWAEGMRADKRTLNRRGARSVGLGTLRPLQDLPADPAVRLSPDIQATIARGETAFQQQSQRKTVLRNHELPRIITAATDQGVQDQRDSYVTAREQPANGRRRQPPMTARLRAVMIVVDRLVAEGVPFGVGPNSRMNKEVRRWLNERASRSSDPRPSRREPIGATAVRKLLKQVKAEGGPVIQRVTQRKRTTQEEARERLKQLLAGRASSTRD